MSDVAEKNTVRETPDLAAPRPEWVMAPERDIVTGGHRIRYWEKGQGRPLVLVHGFSGNAPFEWGRVIDAFAHDFRVVVLQVVGFAPSEQPDITYSTEALVRSLGGFIRDLGLDDFVLLGESFGGWLVGSYAVRAKGYGLPVPAKLVIVGGPVGSMDRVKPGADGFVHDPVKQEVAAWFATQKLYDNEPLKARIGKDSGLMKGELTLEDAATIAMPTLLVWGDQDALIPLAMGERAAATIPGSRLHVFKGIGHIPSVECPNEFVAAVTAFGRP